MPGGVRRDEQYLKEKEDSSNQENKKRRIESESEDGLHSEFQQTHTESMSEFKTSGESPLSRP